jgi:hypothetical protein
MADKPSLVDLQLTKSEKKEETREMVIATSDEQYPYGLCLSLENRELYKLGIDDIPTVGDEWHMLVIGKVTVVNTQSGADTDDSVRVGLQITMAQILKRESKADEVMEKETPSSEAKESKGKMLGY